MPTSRRELSRLIRELALIGETPDHAAFIAAIDVPLRAGEKSWVAQQWRKTLANYAFIPLPLQGVADDRSIVYPFHRLELLIEPDEPQIGDRLLRVAHEKLDALARSTVFPGSPIAHAADADVVQALHALRVWGLTRSFPKGMIWRRNALSPTKANIRWVQEAGFETVHAGWIRKRDRKAGGGYYPHLGPEPEQFADYPANAKVARESDSSLLDVLGLSAA